MHCFNFGKYSDQWNEQAAFKISLIEHTLWFSIDARTVNGVFANK